MSSVHQPVNPADRIFISYPKAGRTWFRFLFNLAHVEAKFTSAGAQGSSGKESRPQFELAEGRKVVFLHRNPIDTAVSLYFHLNSYKYRPYTFRHAKAFLQGALPPRGLTDFLQSPGYGVERVCRFDRAWLDHLAETRADHMVIRYEDMRAAPEPTLAGVLAYFDPGGRHDVAKLVEQASFERMQRVESEGDHDGAMRLGHKNRRDQNARKVRRGKVGGYRDYLSPAEQQHFEAICASYGLQPAQAA